MLHVGHCHPHVVAAICKQAAALNTHTRYLHDGILDYMERLMRTFNHGITSAIMVCTGSKANDIVLRMAQAVTGKTGTIATNHTCMAKARTTGAHIKRGLQMLAEKHAIIGNICVLFSPEECSNYFQAAGYGCN